MKHPKMENVWNLKTAQISKSKIAKLFAILLQQIWLRILTGKS